MKIILASASPRRRELLSALGHEILVVVPKGDELDEKSCLAAERIAVINAETKARSVFSEVGLNDYEVIIAADTVVVLGGLVFGKPKNYDEAFVMLKQLSLGPHQVITAYTIIGAHEQERSRAVSSIVEFRALSGDEIASYLKCDEWRDKAGGYGVQGFGAALIRRVIGSLTNVIGLPIEEAIADAQELIDNS